MSNYEALKVGALLHDIGKWYKLVKNDEDGRHIKYGVKFIEDYKKSFENKNIEVIKKLIKHHHDYEKIETLNIDDETKYLLKIFACVHLKISLNLHLDFLRFLALQKLLFVEVLNLVPLSS